MCHIFIKQFRSRTKHIDLRHHYLKDLVEIAVERILLSTEMRDKDELRARDLT
jgi:hypothetical protein